MLFRQRVVEEPSGTSGSMIRSRRAMRRGVQIIVSLLAIVVLVHPFDCFANARTREAMECCLKGKCAPTAKADDCCKNTVPSVNHFLGSKAAGHSAPVLAVAPSSVFIPVPAASVQGTVDLLRHPPPGSGLNARNLPLLI